MVGFFLPQVFTRMGHNLLNVGERMADMGNISCLLETLELLLVLSPDDPGLMLPLAQLYLQRGINLMEVGIILEQSAAGISKFSIFKNTAHFVRPWFTPLKVVDMLQEITGSVNAAPSGMIACLSERAQSMIEKERNQEEVKVSFRQLGVYTRFISKC